MPSLVPFDAVAHLLPRDCWAVLRQAPDPESLARQRVLLCDHDLRLDALNLDAPLGLCPGGLDRAAGDGEQVDVLLVLVTGHLVVAGPIFNSETDGATGLIVLGDLCARDMIVGGQEIRVTGDLRVDQLFWGDYDHGTLQVDGQAKAGVWLLTGGYDARLGGALVAEAVLDESAEGACPADEAHVARYFSPALMLQIPEDVSEATFGDWLDREAALRSLRDGTPLLQPSFAELPWPTRLASGELTLENLQALLATPLRSAGETRAGLWDGDDFLRLALAGDEDHPQGGAYLQRGKWGYFLGPEKRSGLLSALGNAAPSRLVLRCSDMDDDAAPWRDLATAGPEHRAYVERIWPRWLALLARVEVEWERLTADVTPERVEAIFRLPYVVETFTDADEANNQLWIGNESYCFRLASQGTARILVSRQAPFLTAEGEPDLSHYLFEVVVSDSGQKQVAFSFQPRQEEDGEECLHTLELARRPHDIGKAWRAFLRMERSLLEENRQFLEAHDDRERAIGSQTPPDPPWLDFPAGGEAGGALRLRLVTLAEANVLIGHLCFTGTDAKVFDVLKDPYFEPGSFFLVSDGDLSAQQLELARPDRGIGLAGLIVRGRLTLERHLIDLEDDFSGPLVVLGDLEARHISLGGRTCLVTGDLRCECLSGSANPGSLFVNGTLQADAVVGGACRIDAGAIDCHALVSGTDIWSWNTVLDEAGQPRRQLDFFPSTCRASDVLVESVLGDRSARQPDRAALLQAFREDRGVIDRSKLDTLFAELPTELPGLFDAVFGSPRLEDGQLRVAWDEQHFAFALVDEDEDEIRAIGLETSQYRLEALQDAAGEIRLLHHVYAGEGRRDVAFGGAPTDTWLSALAVKKAVYEALERLEFLPYRANKAADRDELEELPSFSECIDSARRRLFAAGGPADVTAARTELEELAEETRQTFGERAPEVTQVLELQVALAAQSGDDAAVLRHGAEYLAFLHSGVALSERTQRDLHHRMTGAAMALHQPGTALEHLDATLSLRQAEPELTPSQVLFLRSWRGLALRDAGHLETALENDQALLREAEALLGSMHPDLCPLLIGLALDQRALRLDEQAHRGLERSLALARASGRVPEADTALFQLGLLAETTGDATAARRWARERMEHARARGDEPMVERVARSVSEQEERLKG